MRQPAHKFLQEFPLDDADWPQAPVLQLKPREPIESQQAAQVSARVSEAYAKGLEEGRAIARAEAETEIAQLTAGFELRIEEIKATFSKEVARKLGHDLQQRLEEIHTTLEEQVVAALLPILRRNVLERSVRDAASALRGIAGDSEAIVVELSGPDDLVEQVMQYFREQDQGRSGEPVVRLIPGDTTEVRASVNGTLIETRLEDWISKIEEAVR